MPDKMKKFQSMINGKSYGIWALVAVLGTGWGATASAAKQDDRIFQACSPDKVVLVSRDAALKSVPEGCAVSRALETPPELGNAKAGTDAYMMGLKIKDMIHDVYMKDLKQQRASWASLKACFEAREKGAAVNKDCQDRMSKLESGYGTFVGNLRQDMAASRLTADGNSVVSELPATFGRRDIDSQLMSLLPRKYIYPSSVQGKLFPNEINFAKGVIAKSKPSGSVAARESDAAHKYVKDMEQGIDQQKLFLITELPAPKGADHQGRPVWNAKDWAGVIDKLLTYVDQDYNRANTISAGSKVEFHPIQADDFIPWQHEEDLLSYISMKPVVEKYLEKHPEDCGFMIAAAKSWKHTQTVSKPAAQALAMLAVGGGTGALKYLDEFGVFGKYAKDATLLVQAGGGVAGVGIVAEGGRVKINERNEDLHGLEADIENASTRDPASYKEAQQAVKDLPASVASSAILFFGGQKVLEKGLGVAAPWVAKSIYTSAKPSVQAGIDRMMMNMKPEEAKKFIEALAARVDKLSEKTKKTAEQNLAHAERVQVLAAKVQNSRDMLVREGQLTPDDMKKVDEILVKLRDKFEKDRLIKGERKDIAMAEAAADTDHEIKEAARVCKLGAAK